MDPVSEPLILVPYAEAQEQKLGLVLEEIRLDPGRTVHPNVVDFSEEAPISVHVRKNGRIDSPGFANAPYAPNMAQKWRLRADPGHRVRLDFHTLILEDDCEQDFIQIYDSLAPIRQCGYPHGSLAFVSSGNVMLLMLVTSQDKNFPGFRVFYSQVPAANCGGTLRGERGSFSSPFFPANYPPKADCSWSLQVSPAGRFVKVQFQRFSVGKDGSPCLHDYVTIDEKRLCGSQSESSVFISQSNKMSVGFRSDRGLVYPGFSARFEAFVPTDPCPGKFRCGTNLCINTTLRCDGFNDCGDNSDEIDCTCAAMQMKCKNNICKAKFWMCDGVDDCGDNSDEDGCGKCGAAEFSCRNGRCVSNALRCDGRDDCGDASDESTNTDHCSSFMLSLWIRSRWRCTVLTFDLHPWRRHAAADRWDAWLGLHAQGQSNQWTEQRKVKRIVVHPDYDRVSLDGDIALMELEPDLILNQNIWPVCLPSAAHHFPAGQEAWITGWGATVEGGEALLLRTVVNFGNICWSRQRCKGCSGEFSTCRYSVMGSLWDRVLGGVRVCSLGNVRSLNENQTLTYTKVQINYQCKYGA
uniref:Suppression of tumorigenicity 14b n=1 Tax=Poecilia latipinna TaxID=48699 RepID=A0A3B3V5P7_9TELE